MKGIGLIVWRDSTVDSQKLIQWKHRTTGAHLRQLLRFTMGNFFPLKR